MDTFLKSRIDSIKITMSGVLKNIIKDKQESINSHGAEILTKLDEIKCDVESYMRKVGFSYIFLGHL